MIGSANFFLLIIIQKPVMLLLCLVWARNSIRRSPSRATTLSGRKRVLCKYGRVHTVMIFYVCMCGLGGGEELIVKGQFGRVKHQSLM